MSESAICEILRGHTNRKFDPEMSYEKIKDILSVDVSEEDHKDEFKKFQKLLEEERDINIVAFASVCCLYNGREDLLHIINKKSVYKTTSIFCAFLCAVAYYMPEGSDLRKETFYAFHKLTPKPLSVDFFEVCLGRFDCVNLLNKKSIPGVSELIFSVIDESDVIFTNELIYHPEFSSRMSDSVVDKYLASILFGRRQLDFIECFSPDFFDSLQWEGKTDHLFSERNIDIISSIYIHGIKHVLVDENMNEAFSSISLLPSPFCGSKEVNEKLRSSISAKLIESLHETIEHVEKEGSLGPDSVAPLVNLIYESKGNRGFKEAIIKIMDVHGDVADMMAKAFNKKLDSIEIHDEKFKNRLKRIEISDDFSL